MVQFATQLNETNFQAYVPQDRTGEIMSQGIARAGQIQQQGNQLLGQAIDTGINVWKGYEVNRLTDTLNDLNEQYMQSRPQPGVLNNHQSKLDKMTAALEQGSMSPQEYNTRVRALTREAMNRAPAFAPDFIRQANRVFEFAK
jgi:hypothetical protein